MIVTTECRALVAELQRDLAPIVARVAEMGKVSSDLAKMDLGGFQKVLKADLLAHQQLKSSLAAAHRLLAKIDDDLYAIEAGRRRPAARRRPMPPFDDDDDDAKAFKQPGRTIH